MWDQIICKIFGHTIGNCGPDTLYDLLHKPHPDYGMMICYRCGDWHRANQFVQFKELEKLEFFTPNEH